MHGSLVDIALLVILVLFFGRQQSQRPETYYRLWFAGWIFTLASYAVWLVPISVPLYQQLQGAVRIDFTLIGMLFFLISFVIHEDGVRKMVLQGMLVGVPVLLIFNAIEVYAVPRSVVITGVVAWEIYGIRAARMVIPKGRKKTRFAIVTITAVFGLTMIAYLMLTQGKNIFYLALAEVVFCSAVLYGGGHERRSLSNYIGMAGFTLWGGFYLCGILFQHGWPRALEWLFLFWTVPKFFVGSSMILKTLEDETREKAAMGEAYQQLYRDSRMMFEGHPNPMWVYAKGDGKILSANEAAVSRYGYTVDEFLGMCYDDLEVTDDTDASLIESLYGESKEMFSRHQFKAGQKIWVCVSQSSLTFEGVDAVFKIARDVTDRVEMNQKRMYAASHDLLTGLPNRALLEDRILQNFKRCERDGRKSTLLTIDVDHFKQINDTYGHQVGDECLQIVAARLASKIRQVDTIARVGGEEFAAIIGGLSCAEDAGKVAESLLRVFREPLQIGALDVSVTVSIGIAVYPDDALDAESRKRRSDEALYAAKRGGRNRAVFASGMEEPMLVSTVAARGRRAFDVTMVTEESLGT